MATTSGTATTGYTCTHIVNGALRALGVIGENEPISGPQFSDALEALNMMIKNKMGRERGLWLQQEATLFLALDDESYKLGPTGAHCAVFTNSDTLQATAASGATTITVTDGGDIADDDGVCESQTPAASFTINGDWASENIATFPTLRKVSITSDADESGISFVVTGTNLDGVSITSASITGPNATRTTSAEYFKTVTGVAVSGACTGNVTIGGADVYIGIELDSGALEWRTISSELAGVITISSALSGAAGSGNAVYSYSQKIERPDDIMEARFVEDDDERLLHVLNIDEYAGLTPKNTTGQAIQIYYSPTLINGTLYTWPVCDDVTTQIKMTLKLPIEIFESVSDSCHFPDPWLEALKFNLALRMAPEYRINPSNILLANAAESLKNARSYGAQKAPIYFQPGF